MVPYAGLLLLGASTVLASPLAPRHESTPSSTSISSPPAATPYEWNAGSVSDFQIHSSCNASQRAYIHNGLQETLTLTRHARDHILRFGNQSEIYRKYFGDAPTGEPLGWFTKIADGDKSNVLFRCDDIDGNCHQDGWAGHHRGSNATSETVICDLSYELRLPLSGLCMFGYTVANSATNLFWASDLMHRLLHIPQISEGIIGHYGDEYPIVLELAKNDTAMAVKNSDSLQYFALEAYAHDVAVPGIGCVGKYEEHEEHDHASATSSVSQTAATTTAIASSSESSVASSTAAAATTSEAVEACTPHGDHWHCPPGVPEPTSPPS